MKKGLFVILIATMLLAGCGASGDEGTESVPVKEMQNEVGVTQNDVDIEAITEDTEVVEDTEVSVEETTQVESEEISTEETTDKKEETTQPSQEKTEGETQQSNQDSQSGNNTQQSHSTEQVQPDNTQNDTSNDVVDTSNEVCPYPLYVIQYDNQGYPYFYGKWGGSANMDADNLAKTESCKEQWNVFMCEHFMVNDYLSFDYSWQSIGNYQGMNVVVRYIETCNGEYLGSPESRGIPTAGNGIWID